MKLDPADVLVTRNGKWGYRRTACGGILERRRRSEIQPMVEFRMPVRERITSGLIMVHPRHVLIKLKNTGIIGRISFHIGQIVSPIDAVLTLVHKHPGLGWSRR